MPLVIVLTNPDAGVVVDLSVEHVLAALYGNLGYTVPIDRATGGPVGDGQYMLGRDGALTDDRQYVSAVGLLRRREEGQDERDELFASVRDETPGWGQMSPREQSLRYLTALDGITFSDRSYYWLDVIETASTSAVPLSDDWFAGSRDSRWRLVDEERFEQVER